jgi:hypothetical protein
MLTSKGLYGRAQTWSDQAIRERLDDVIAGPGMGQFREKVLPLLKQAGLR